MAFLILPCAILLSACKQETKPQEPEIPEPKTSINITFASKYGNLEFSSKELDLTNGFAYIQDADLPTITNEGNDKIFDYWAAADGEKFNFDLKVYDDVDLQAVFCYDLEFIWEENWDLYDSLSLYRQEYDSTIYVTEDGGVTNVSSSFGSSSYSPTFRKIKKSDCLDKYITKDEYKKLPNSACFVTDAYKDTIVTEEDITTDTYACYQYIFVEDSYYGLSNIIAYLPKGVSASAWVGSYNIAKNYAKQVLIKEYGLNYDQFNYDNFSCDQVKGENGINWGKNRYFTVDEFRELNQQSLTELFNTPTENMDGKDWQEDVYYAVSQYNWIKFSCTLEDGTVKYFVLEKSNNVAGYKLYDNVSKEYYDALTN